MISRWEIARRDSPTRRRYVEWQNGLLTPAAMASARFVELPALRQTGLYRRAALDALRCPVGGGDAETYHDLVEWPIDSDFWYRWFEAGFVAGKARPRNRMVIDHTRLIRRFPLALSAGGRAAAVPLAPARGTAHAHAGPLLARVSARVQGALPAEARRAGARRSGIGVLNEFIHDEPYTKPSVPQLPQAIHVWSTGRTLTDWTEALRNDSNLGGTVVMPSTWKPGAPPPNSWQPRRASAESGAKAGGGAGGGTSGAVGARDVDVDEAPMVRLFAFGMEKAREKARRAVRDWDDRYDWFVA